MADLIAVLSDLRDESDALETLVIDLPASGWTQPTPAAGWTIAHQIAHLSWTDDASVKAATDVDAFNAAIGLAMVNPTTFVDEAAAAGAAVEPALLLQTWRERRAALQTALAAVPAGEKVPWFGPAMSPTSMATARLMETWAHGQDVADALGVERTPTDRLRNIAHIGVRTRDFAYLAREKTPPSDPFRVELTSPSGEQWAWGPADVEQRVTGTALDFCLLVTQRRHRDDLGLTAIGADADAWLDIAQAFAGPPGAGRPAGEAG
ncbi:MAG: TIGR03084 family metal-binding protein [Jatrophihabitans sp.]